MNPDNIFFMMVAILALLFIIVALVVFLMWVKAWRDEDRAILERKILVDKEVKKKIIKTQPKKIVK